MKVITEIPNVEWNIMEGDRQVGHIVLDTGYRWRSKRLYVKNHFVSEIKNKNDAIKKLEQFFIQNKRDIIKTEETIELLLKDLGSVNHQLSLKAIKAMIEAKEIKLEELKSLDLM